MKRNASKGTRHGKKSGAPPLREQLALLQAIVQGLVARMGGQVHLTPEEMNGLEGDRMEMVSGYDGVTLQITMPRRLVLPGNRRLN